MKAERPWAWPLVPLYAAGLALKDGMRAAGVLQVRRLGWPVASVGSLSAGGAGKTPVVIALAELLHQHGWIVDVLSRGYGREGRGVERVLPESAAAARRFGDEPMLIAQRAHVPVWVAAERLAAGQMAEAASKTETRHVHLLDDGFQHRQLARSVDIVLVTAADLNDPLLPAGNRREPWTALRRADIMVVREEEQPGIAPKLERYARPDAPLWTIRRQIRFPEAAPVPAQGHVIFTAIARPDDFVRMLREAGVSPIAVLSFPDHHRYTPGDVDRLLDVLRASAGSGLVTTEKDAVKLSGEMRARLEAAGSLVVVRLEATFADEASVLRDLEARLT